MLVIVALVFAALSFGPQVVLSFPHALIHRATVSSGTERANITFGDIEQCGPVVITFSGNKFPAQYLPTTLTLLPFNSVPISIDIPNTSVDSIGVSVTFLPLPAGTKFLASLDNAAGKGYVSDVLQILPSPSGDSSCLPKHPAQTPVFQLLDTVSQCQPFRVTYNMSLVPTLRAFVPSDYSLPLNQTSSDVYGEVTYMAALFRQVDVLFMFDDGQNNRATTGLIEVGGDANTDSSCLPYPSSDITSTYTMMNTGFASSKTSTGAVIGIVLAVMLTVSFIAAAMLFWVARQRRLRRGVSLGDGLPGKSAPASPIQPLEHMNEKREESSLPFPPRRSPSIDATNLADPTFVRNPLYTRPSYNSVNLLQTSTQSPHLSAQHPSMLSFTSQSRRYAPEMRSERSSISSSIDIEGILDMATTMEENNASTSVGSVNLLNRMPSRGHLRDPSDIPPPLLSVTSSEDSVNQSMQVPQSVNPAHLSARSDNIIRLSYDSNRSGDEQFGRNVTFGLPAAPQPTAAPSPTLSKHSRDRLSTIHMSPNPDRHAVSGLPRDVTSWNSQASSWYEPAK